MRNNAIVLVFCFWLVLGFGQALGVEDLERGFDHLDKMKTTSSTSAPANELLLDSTVKSFFGDASSTLTRWRTNHFTLFLFSVSILAGLGVGFMAA